MERIERLQDSLFLRSDVMLTGNCLSALCFILGMVMLGVHSFVEERDGFVSVVELHNVPASQISYILILMSTIVPAGERLQRLYIARLQKRLENPLDN
ncbi:hypothetical protein BIW11_06316 [Tropilaelaps mercedesae]|uniref:Uncharacterized protein n=1 Tax=Tropilaelaps mercedesae TaxID=418985 RepID=A0A1V9XYK6_9ACAR|nr:hypothetical protein BIW11_06316 [Tropilaelaps mercedesae]